MRAALAGARAGRAACGSGRRAGPMVKRATPWILSGAIAMSRAEGQGRIAQREACTRAGASVEDRAAAYAQTILTNANGCT